MKRFFSKMTIKKILLLLVLFALSTPIFLSLGGCDKKVKFSPTTLCLQFNDYLSRTKEDGTHQQLIDKWYSLESINTSVDYKSLRGSNGTLKVSLFEGNMPFSYIYNNDYTGLIIEMVTDFCKEYNYKVEFKGYSNVTSLIASVTTGNADICAALLTVTPERERAVLFSDPFIDSGNAIAIKKSDAMLIKSQEDLSNKKIGIITNSVYEDVIKEFATGCEFLTFGSDADMCLALESGIVDCVVSDGATIRHAILYHPELCCIDVDIFENLNAFMFRKTTYSKFEELEGKTIGVFDDPEMIEGINNVVKNANLKLYDYEDEALIKSDLDKGVIDGAGAYVDVMRYGDLTLKGYSLISTPFAFRKGTMVFPISQESKIIQQYFNQFIEDENNKLIFNQLKRKYVNKDTRYSIEVPNYQTLPATNGVLKIGLDGALSPFSIYENGVYKGVFVDYVTLFAKEYGYGLEFANCELYDVEDWLNSGRINAYIDVGSIKEEDFEHITSKVFGQCAINVIVRDSYNTKVSFFEEIASNFRKTFIIENRYQLFLDGVVTTLIITVASIVIGLALGFLIYLILRNGHKLSKIIYKIIDFLVSGTPAVVLLMILYYLVFKSAEISGTVVAVVGFSLIFMCDTVSFLTVGFNSIDKGQQEAAYALGYGKIRTFFKILFPQAAQHFVPILKGNIVSHIKSTAIVGYIAVVDLTRASELVRSRTFDAFFSLIVATILYFALEYLFIFILSRIPVDPKKRKKISALKGVEKNDRT